MVFGFDIYKALWRYHEEQQPFVAIHPDVGVVFAAGEYDDFQCEINDKRPSFLRQLKLTCTNLWVVQGPKEPC